MDVDFEAGYAVQLATKQLRFAINTKLKLIYSLLLPVVLHPFLIWRAQDCQGMIFGLLCVGHGGETACSSDAGLSSSHFGGSLSEDGRALKDACLATLLTRVRYRGVVTAKLRLDQACYPLSLFPLGMRTRCWFLFSPKTWLASRWDGPLVNAGSFSAEVWHEERPCVTKANHPSL